MIDMRNINFFEYNLLSDRNIINNNKNDYIICPVCKKKITFNECTSHSKVHPEIINEKRKFIKKKYKFQNYCYCGKEIIIPENIRDSRRKHTHFCSSKCFDMAKKIVKEYYKTKSLNKKCIICGKKFNANHIETKTCSYNC
jgi:hypothetical protein